jgi:hypothetical protein
MASKLAPLQSPIVSPHSLNYGIQVHTIMASKCIYTRLITLSESISNFTRSQPTSVSPNTLDYHLHVHLHLGSITASKFTWPLPPSASQTCPGTGFKCIIEFVRSQPPSASLHSLICRLQVLLRLGSSTVCSQIGCMYIYRD